jgi:hypothetical protein
MNNQSKGCILLSDSISVAEKFNKANFSIHVVSADVLESFQNHGIHSDVIDIDYDLSSISAVYLDPNYFVSDDSRHQYLVRFDFMSQELL